MRRALAFPVVAALTLGAAVAVTPAQAPAPRPEARVADSLFDAGAFGPSAAAYERLIRADSSVPRHWARLGSAYARTGNYQRAASAFEQAATRGGNAVAIYNAAATNARLGRRERALDWLDSAVKAGFNMPSAIKADSDFASLRSHPRFVAAVAAIEHAFTPCATDSDARRFDFWLGEWDVRTPRDQPAGASRIELVSGGCALLENWTDRMGSQGKSLSAFNRALGQWQQYWVGQLGPVTEYRESTWRAGSLSFLARLGRPGADTLARMTFTPLSRDLVRQHGEQSADGGRTWTTTFDLHYHRRK